VHGLRKAEGEDQVDLGTVKWFNSKKGFGFITPDEGGADLFVHHSNIATEGYRSLQDGQRVEYEAAQGRKGPEATNVKPSTEESASPEESSSPLES